jgi:ABC-type iron transport system FetAB ATPase subunit
VLEVIGLRRLHVGPLSLRVADGECVSVMGASGAGKSVLLRMMADLDPHAGEMRLDGVAASAMPAPDWRAQVTYVAADAGWWAPRVAEHFAPGADPARLQELGISAEAFEWSVERLSTGERQRLALLRAIRERTRVLLLDEPTSGLDPENVQRVESLLHGLLEHGLAIVLVTHDRAQARRLASAHWRLADGRISRDDA